MDKLFESTVIPWPFKIIILLLSGLGAALPILLIPKKWLALIGQKSFLSPNWISIWRTLIFWIGTWLYFFITPFYGFLVVVIGCILDVTDGKMAKAYEEYGVPRSKQDTDLGKVIDPLSDKLTTPVLIVVFGYLQVVSLPIAIAILATDMAGTLLRHFKDAGRVLVYKGRTPRKIGAWLLRLDRALNRVTRATAVGKIKALIQNFVLITCFPYHQDWINEPNVANWLCVIALALGLLSVISRLRLHVVVDRWVDRTGTFFSHQDV